MKRLAVPLLCLALACGDDDMTSDPMDAGPVTCEADPLICDDGVFCNGVEVCAPGARNSNQEGCVAGVAPCGDDRCDESLDTCVVGCDNPDVDGDGSDAVECGGDDCDDENADVFPGATEVCDVDHVDEDCDPTTVGERDLDSDGAIDSACCNGETCGTDCADALESVGPNASESCNLIDDDCDGEVDEGVQAMGFRDSDGDLHGDPTQPTMGCAFDNSLSPTDVDCSDDDALRHGFQLELCDMQDNDCDEGVDESRFAITWYVDSDGDGFGNGAEGMDTTARVSCEPLEGYSPLPFDCDDTDGSVSPVGPELCNGRDDDCDGRSDYIIETGNTEDDDGDGFADLDCPGDVGDDCDDRDPFAYPGAPELCDGVDNDCDGTVDEGSSTTVEWYTDEDGDLQGNPDAERRASCERQPGRVLNANDCDDGDRDVYSGAREVCNGRDDDCDGNIDENAPLQGYYQDQDRDGIGAGAPVVACGEPDGLVALAGDCDDTDPDRAPGAPEICDGLDNDCDGDVDEDAGEIVWYRDADGDGAGDESQSVMSCDRQPGYVRTAGDCDDSSPSIFPGAPEICDSADQDCDGATDEDSGDQDWFVDIDGDGWGDDTVPAMQSCEPIAGRVIVGGDCDDRSAAIYPGATEACNSVDDDCDGVADEPPAAYAECAGQGTVPLCIDGRCAYESCLPGYGDCDGNTETGCESDFNTDARHCGGCDVSCGLSDQCVAGGCERSPVTDVEMGFNHGCAIRNGNVWCWGNNAEGRLGDPLFQLNQASFVPRPVIGIDDAIDVACGGAHTCAISESQGVLCWGRNVEGQLGSAAVNPVLTPTPVTDVSATAVAIESGVFVTCVLTEAAEVRCWGVNDNGLFGNDGDVGEPALRHSDDQPLTGVVHHRMNNWRACATLDDATLWCWGADTVYHALGTGIGMPFTPTNRAAPVIGLTNALVAGIGFEHTCAVRTDGSVWCWGRNDVGQLGRGMDMTPSDIPAPVQGLSDAVDINAGRQYTCARREDGTAVCWGSNANGLLGDPAFTDLFADVPRSVPGGVTEPGPISIALLVGANGQDSTVVASGHRIYGWGDNINGRLGVGNDINPTTSATPVVGFDR